MEKRILLFGGTFDPVHHGHLIVARAIAEAGRFEKVTLVPTSQPPHKGGPIASARHRLRMLQLATEGSEMFDICDAEIGRAGPSYTLDTLKQLRAEHGPAVRLHWVIGADMLEDLPSWHRISEVLELAQMVVAARHPWQDRLDKIFAHLNGQLGPIHVNNLRKMVLQTPMIEISSTAIRQRLSLGLDVRYLVPEKVDRYIQEHRLYL
jgi:nicotinate-nucleotide adenylyltransferase